MCAEDATGLFFQVIGQHGGEHVVIVYYEYFFLRICHEFRCFTGEGKKTSEIFYFLQIMFERGHRFPDGIQQAVHFFG